MYMYTYICFITLHWLVHYMYYLYMHRGIVPLSSVSSAFNLSEVESTRGKELLRLKWLLASRCQVPMVNPTVPVALNPKPSPRP